MATTINADNSTGGAVVTGDGSGVLALQAAGVTKVTINGSGVTLADPLPVSSGGTGSTSAAFVNLATNVTGTLPVANGGTGVTTSTGSGNNVLSTSPALTTPVLTNLITDGSITEEVFALGTSGSLSLNPTNGTIQTCSLTGNPTFTDGLTAGQSLILMLANGASYTVAWPTMTWVTSGGNVAPTLTAADTVVLWKIGVTLYGAYVGSYV